MLRLYSVFRIANRYQPKSSFAGKILMLFVAFSFCFLNAWTQKPAKKMMDVVYLKDGGVLKGKIQEIRPGEVVKVEIMGGSIFVIKMSDVEKITEEPLTKSFGTKPPHVYREGIGYSTNTTLGMMIAGLGEVRYSIQTVHGVHLNPRITVGAGIGIDRYDIADRLVPVFLDARGDINPNNPCAIYYYGQIGLAFDWLADNFAETEEIEIGPTWALGMGMKFNMRQNLRWLINFGFREVGMARTTNWGTGTRRIEYTNRGVVIGFGIQY